MNQALQRLLPKISHHAGRDWCAYLTASEIVLVCEQGAQPTVDRTLTRARESVAEGKSNPSWFYFRPQANLLALLQPKSRVAPRGRT